MARNEIFERWRDVLAVCHAQVCRALDNSASLLAAECGLAVVATAILLEGYLNLHAKQVLAQHLHKPFSKLEAAQKYLLAPRLAGRSASICDRYEQDHLHELAKELFTLRNKFAHGNVHKWDPGVVGPQKVVELWNGGLELIGHLETVGMFRIPESRHQDFREELDGLRVVSPPDAKERWDEATGIIKREHGESRDE